jgi:hypothetical protein
MLTVDTKEDLNQRLSWLMQMTIILIHSEDNIYASCENKSVTNTYNLLMPVTLIIYYSILYQVSQKAFTKCLFFPWFVSLLYIQAATSMESPCCCSDVFDLDHYVVFHH